MILSISSFVMKVRDIQDSIEIIKSKPKPLAIYAFTKDENLKTRILSETSSGSVTFNDVMIQVYYELFYQRLEL